MRASYAVQLVLILNLQYIDNMFLQVYFVKKKKEKKKEF